ncbi:carboxypeptidase-like regulatory domain-containing protein [Sphingobacterium siyangense]|uniref:carboxypeptidase-like regulatory domain-containing protein n=1 Tax=Sphingobacterium siyangense TaxID=459529 RepID=UPI003DA51897
MKILQTILSCLLITLMGGHLVAQEKTKGIIMELVSGEKIEAAQIQNLRTKAEVQTNRDGSFAIDANINDLLLIKAVGYEQDTVFIYDSSLRRIYLNRMNNVIELNEVVVERMTDSRLAAEIQREKTLGKYSDASKNRGGVRISPSRIFSKEGKQARSNHKLLVAELEKRAVDRKFTENLIKELTPLNGSDLALFKERFRPSYKFIQNSSQETLKVYIMDSYKKFNEKK